MGSGYLMWKESKRGDPSEIEAAEAARQAFERKNLHHGLPEPHSKEYNELLQMLKNGTRRELEQDRKQYGPEEGDKAHYQKHGFNDKSAPEEDVYNTKLAVSAPKAKPLDFSLYEEGRH